MIEDVVRPKPKSTPKLAVRRRKKTSERKKLEKQLDALCRDIVLTRDYYACVCPPPQKGHYGALQAGHLITRCKESIRWDLYNIHVQCQSCNMRHESFSHYYTEWFLEKFGLENYSRLCRDGETVKKLQVYELEELLSQLKAIREKQLVGVLMGDSKKTYYTQAEILSGAWRAK